jgi:hypothetical protein
VAIEDPRTADLVLNQRQLERLRFIASAGRTHAIRHKSDPEFICHNRHESQLARYRNLSLASSGQIPQPYGGMIYLDAPRR